MKKSEFISNYFALAIANAQSVTIKDAEIAWQVFQAKIQSQLQDQFKTGALARYKEGNVSSKTGLLALSEIRHVIPTAAQIDRSIQKSAARAAKTESKLLEFRANTDVDGFRPATELRKLLGLDAKPAEKTA